MLLQFRSLFVKANIMHLVLSARFCALDSGVLLLFKGKAFEEKTAVVGPFAFSKRTDAFSYRLVG